MNKNMSLNVVCDLIILKYDIENDDWKEFDTIYCFDHLFYDDAFKCLYVNSHGLQTKIKHFEDFRFEFRYRVIDYSNGEIEKDFKID